MKCLHLIDPLATINRTIPEEIKRKWAEICDLNYQLSSSVFYPLIPTLCPEAYRAECRFTKQDRYCKFHGQK